MNKAIRGLGCLGTVLCLSLGGASHYAVASSTDLATVPLVTSSSTAVKPNVMFVLDDSGSMGGAYMPDVVADWGTSSYGYWSAQCNGLAYNPSITYTPPVTYAGVSYSDSSITAAWYDGFDTSAGATSLSSAYFYTYSGAQTAAAQKTYYTTTSTFYKECASRIGYTPGSSVFTKVLVSSLTTAQKTNYANWYSYYRTRILAMKSAAGLAFKSIDNRYRIGFMTINNASGSDLINITDFDSTQKQKWYQKLYAANASGSTPTRSALAVAGLIFANKISSYNSVAVTDPMQYSCQQNFAIMASDGFWNSGSCNNGSAGCYNGGAGVKLDGSSSVGNQDYVAARPYFDGSATSTVVTTTYKTYTSTQSTTTSGCYGPNNGKVKVVTTTVTTTRVVVTTDGLTTSDTSSTSTSTSTGSSCVSNPTLTSSSGTTSGYPTVSTSTTGTNIANTMADVAYYYYTTDLRSSANGNATGALGVDVASNNVPGSGKDTATWQHMTTFTLGLGAYGRMIYSPTYESDTSGDYYNIKVGNKNATGSTSTCSWAASGATCNWPVPSSNAEENIDDLWHAAVNGRGTYYSATDPSALTTGLTGALSGVSARLGASAAATTSNPNVTSGDNYVFSTTFVSQSWYGELVRQTIDLNTGTVSAIDSYPCSSSICDWSAQSLLDARVAASSDTRTIYTYDASVSGKLKSFSWSTLNSTEKAYFNASAISTLSQWSGLSTTNQTLAAGENLVAFLRGQRAYEGTLYRTRDHVLGDIVSSEAVYVKAPQFSYTDSGYSDFKSSNTSRTAMVYVGANDGMLHAFNAATGQEVWAYMPSIVLPSLYKLADTNYANNHRYFVDGTPVVGDICTSGCSTSAAVWKTILVGGLNGGGRGFYALDITDPSAPKALWEYSVSDDSDVGYSFGNPVITKRSDGSWVALLTSGYNNVSPGTGGGYLFVLDAATGTISGSSSAGKIATGVGDTAVIAGVCTTAPCPSGLARINAWADDASTNNTALRVYGGDLFGNLWRFDINNTLGATGYEAQRLAYFTSPSGVRQPVTVKPELGLVDDTYPVVLLGTGRFLGTTDSSDTTVQSFYAIKDPLTAMDWGAARSAAIVAQTLTTTTDSSGATVRTLTSNNVDWSSKIGWYIDLPSSGERANTDPTLVLGTLVFTTNIPLASACSIGGESWLYYIDYTDGSAVSGSDSAATWLGNELSTRAEIVRLPNGSIISITRGSGGSTTTKAIPISTGSTTLRRINWRELIIQ